MNDAVRGAEIWRPDADGWLLEHDEGLYGAAVAFDAVSRTMCFGRGEGLPGRAWDEARPILLEDLSTRSFRRARFAARAGFGAAIAIPYFVGPRIGAVAVLFLADARVVRLSDDVCEGDDAIGLDVGGARYALTLPVATERIACSPDALPRIERDASTSYGRVLLPTASARDGACVVTIGVAASR